MLTIEDLRAWGADVDEALARCMNNEAFYLRLVGKAVQDGAFERLKAACEAGDLDGAFEAAHALKGTMGNLALTPIRRPVEQATELLRNRTAADYSELIDEIMSARDRLTELAQ